MYCNMSFNTGFGICQQNLGIYPGLKRFSLFLSIKILQLKVGNMHITEGKRVYHDQLSQKCKLVL